MAATAARPTATSTSRAANVTLWVLQVVLAVVYLLAAAGKFTAGPEAIAMYEAMGVGVTGMYVIAVLEVAAAIAMFVPRLTGLAALGLVALMIGAVILTIGIGAGGFALVPAVPGVLAAVVAWGRRDSLRRLVAPLRR